MNNVSKLSLLILSTVMTVQSNAVNNEQEVKETRFIPVELFTGSKWNGKHELTMKEVSTSTCSSYNGRPCSEFKIVGPFKTDEFKTKIEWAGDQVSYYRRTFTIPSRGDVISYFTINNSRDGLVRVFDKRKQWGERFYDGLGSKFPLGNWKQGEVRSYPSKRPTKIEILELYGENDCLTFRWTIGDGSRRNSDNIYTFCPNVGLTNIQPVKRAKANA